MMNEPQINGLLFLTDSFKCVLKMRNPKRMRVNTYVMRNSFKNNEY